MAIPLLAFAHPNINNHVINNGSHVYHHTSMHRVWSKYLARAKDRLTSPVAWEDSA